MITENKLPQLVYWRNGSAEAQSLSTSLAAEKWEARFGMVETPDELEQVLHSPQLHLIVSHAHLMTQDIIKKLQSICPDAVLVVIGDDKKGISDDLRNCAQHVVSVDDLEQLPGLMRRSLKRTTRFFSLKDERDTACERSQFLNKIDEAVIARHLDGKISTWNYGATKLFGWTEQEAIGRPASELLTILNEVGENEIAAALSTRGIWVGELHYRGKDMREVFVKVRRTGIQGDPLNGTLEICSDVTGERFELRKTRMVSDAQALFRTSLPMSECLKQFADLIVPACADVCVIDLLVDNELIQRAEVVARNSAFEALIPELREDFPIFPSNKTTALDAMRRNQPEITTRIDDIAVFLGITNEKVRKELKKVTSASALTSVILADGKPTGILSFLYMDAARKFNESDKHRLAQFAFTIGVAIEHSRLKMTVRTDRSKTDSGMYYKDAFLGAVSHELRTPLQAMFGWTQLMRDKKLTALDTEKALDALELSLNAQNKIVNDLLDMSRINSGKLELTPRSIELAPLVENTVEGLFVSAGIKQIELRFQSNDEPVWVMADAAWLQRCLWRVLSNSVKFTPMGGSINVTLSADSAFAQVTITDTGIGIEPKYMPHIFEHFSQADMSTTRSHYGLGIGLAIARHVIEAHGGSIEAESGGLNKGSTFTLKLPLCTPTDSGETSDSSPEYGTDISLAGVRILVVEDELDTRKLLCFVLDQAGAKVEEASSVAEGLAALAKSRFDILISDIGMPHEDGLSLIRKVRALPQESGGRIPALALTAYASKEDRVQALRAGYQMHAPKPVDISELLLIITALMNNTLK